MRKSRDDNTSTRTKAPFPKACTTRKVPRPVGLEVKATQTRRSVVGAEGLHIEAGTAGKRLQRISLWIFPNASGALEELAASNARATVSKDTQANGIESDKQQKASAEAVAGAETLAFAPLHLRLTQVALMDQTDNHNELVSEREWLLMPNEAKFELQGCVLSAENTLDGTGVVFLKLAPLPHARPDKAAVDFAVNPGARGFGLFRRLPGRGARLSRRPRGPHACPARLPAVPARVSAGTRWDVS